MCPINTRMSNQCVSLVEFYFFRGRGAANKEGVTACQNAFYGFERKLFSLWERVIAQTELHQQTVLWAKQFQALYPEDTVHVAASFVQAHALRQVWLPSILDFASTSSTN